MKDNSKTITRLIDITKSIKTIYTNLKDAKKENDSKKYNKYLKYLNISEEIENNLYDELDITVDNTDEIIKTLIRINKRKEYNEEDKLSIERRIEAYILKKLYGNPFLSDSECFQDAINDNTYSIEIQAATDIQLAVLYYINQALKKENNKEIRNMFIDEKYMLLFENKSLEKYLKENAKKPIYQGRKKCIEFNQDKRLVTNIYQKICNENINNSLLELFNITDENLTEDTTSTYYENIELINLKIGLNMLTEEELKQIYYSFYKNVLKDDELQLLIKQANISFQNVINMIKQEVEKNIKLDRKEKKKIKDFRN